jgi:hypothetical protein
MKLKLTLFSLTLFLSFGALLAQEKLTDKKLIGTWKLEIDIEDAMQEAEEEMEEEGNLLGEIILSGVSGMVEGIMDNIDIYFEFKKGGDVIIYVNSFDESDEEEISTWYINKKGHLIIEGTESNKVNIEDSDYWILMDGLLWSVDQNTEEMEENVYMVKIE